MKICLSGKNILICFLFAILMLNPLIQGMYDWLAESILMVMFNNEVLSGHVSLLGHKLKTISTITSVFVLFLFFYSEIKNLIKSFCNDKTLLRYFFYVSILTAPGLLFYFITLELFSVDNILIIFFGAVSAYFVEILIITSLFFVSTLLSSTVFSILIIAVYAIIVFCMAILVRFSGEVDYLKYLNMVWGSDLSWLLSWKIVIVFLFSFLIITFIVRRADVLFRENKNKFISFAPAGLLGFLFVYSLSPLILIGDFLSLPERSGGTHFIALDSSNTSFVVGAHLPYFIKSFFISNKYEYANNISVDDKIFNEKYNLIDEYSDDLKGVDIYSFNKIILLTVESLSLDFINHNKKSPCSKTITPNIDDLMDKYSSGVLWTSASPTLQGLSAIFSSHPNSKLIIEEGYPNSFVRILNDNGYRTVFMRSASEKYANEHVHFKKAGFDEIYGKEYFTKEMKLDAHVSGWGLEDSYLYAHTIEFLKKQKGRKEKLFLHLLPADTHTPYGREYYSSNYPELDNELKCMIDNERLLNSFYRQDFDIGNFYNELLLNDLLDPKTLFIITADHSAPGFYNPAPPVLNKIPIIFISKEKISGLYLDQPNISQVDIAPTILELSGITPPWGYYGKSLLTRTTRSYIGEHNNIITFRGRGGDRKVSLSIPASDEDEQLISFFNTVFIKDN